MKQEFTLNYKKSLARFCECCKQVDAQAWSKPFSGSLQTLGKIDRLRRHWGRGQEFNKIVQMSFVDGSKPAFYVTSSAFVLYIK